MKTKIILFVLTLLLLSCDSTVKAEYNTIKAKKVILIGDDGKEYLLTIKTDSLGNPRLGIQTNK
jgi:hypothetical protein